MGSKLLDNMIVDQLNLFSNQYNDMKIFNDESI